MGTYGFCMVFRMMFWILIRVERVLFETVPFETHTTTIWNTQYCTIWNTLLNFDSKLLPILPSQAKCVFWTIWFGGSKQCNMQKVSCRSPKRCIRLGRRFMTYALFLLRRSCSFSSTHSIFFHTFLKFRKNSSHKSERMKFRTTHPSHDCRMKFRTHPEWTFVTHKSERMN